MAFTTGNQQRGHSPGGVRSGKRSRSFQALLLCQPLPPPPLHRETISLWGHLSNSHICSFILVRWFLGSNYRNISIQNKVSDNSFSEKSMHTALQVQSTNQNISCPQIYAIYARIIKVGISNPVSQFGEEMKGFDSGFFNASRQQYCYPDTQSSFWQKMSCSHLHSILISPRLLICLWISGFSWEP